MEIIHSMTERLTDCEKCNTINSLTKIPNNIAVHYKDDNVGKVVKDYIENAKEELREEKEQLKIKDYKE